MLHHSKEAAPPQVGKGRPPDGHETHGPRQAGSYDAFMISACFASFMAANSAS